jgi:hypothetical protein
MIHRPFVCSDALFSHLRSRPKCPRTPVTQGERMPESAIATLAPVAGLDVALSDGVLSVTIDRPDSLNSVTTQVLAGIADAMEHAATDPAVKVVRLGDSGRGFCSGAGMGADDVGSSGPGAEIIAEANRAIRAITALPGPGLRSRIGLGESIFHARVQSGRVDARRRRVGVGRRGDRPDPRHADGTVG